VTTGGTWLGGFGGVTTGGGACGAGGATVGGPVVGFTGGGVVLGECGVCEELPGPLPLPLVLVGVPTALGFVASLLLVAGLPSFVLSAAATPWLCGRGTAALWTGAADAFAGRCVDGAACECARCVADALAESLATCSWW
jgi:hypothetical protein